MIRKASLGLGLAALLSTPALAADWTSIGANSDGDTFYVRSATAPQNGYQHVWERLELPSPQSADAEAKAQSMLSLYEIDCLNQRIRNLQTTEYSGPELTGEPGDQSTNAGDWQYVAPGTMFDSMYQFACR